MFLGWYVNFQRPMVRTSLGYDTMDMVLDIMVRPDRRWRWKDQDDFEVAIERRIVEEVEEEARAPIMAEANRAIGLLDRRDGPFAPERATWRAPPPVEQAKPSLRGRPPAARWRQPAPGPLSSINFVPRNVTSSGDGKHSVTSFTLLVRG